MASDQPIPGKCGRRLARRNPPQYCMQPAGNRTIHSGEGACWLHGGISRRDDKRIAGRFGLWARILTDEQRERYEQILADGGPAKAVVEGAAALLVKLADLAADPDVVDERKVDLLSVHLPRVAGTISSLARVDERATAAEQMFRDQAQAILQRMVDEYLAMHGTESLGRYLARVFPDKVPPALHAAPDAGG